MGDTKFKKGHPKLPNAGRKKGVPNKITTDLKQFYFDILNSKEMGGLQGAIDLFSKTDRNKLIFFQMISKMLPTNIQGEINGTLILKLSNEFLPKEKE